MSAEDAEEVGSSSSGESEEDDELPPLHEACQEGDIDRVRELLSEGSIDVNEPLPGNYTPLYIAACTNRADIVQVLLDANADPDVAEEETGECALTVCAQQGFAELVGTLLAASANPDAQNKIGASSTFVAAHQGHSSVIAQLIAAGADIDAPKADGATPAIISASKGHDECLRRLIEAKARLEEQLHKGAWTALRMACGFKHNGCVRLLLSAGVVIDPKSAAYIEAHPECRPAVPESAGTSSSPAHEPDDEDDPFSPSSPQNRIGRSGFSAVGSRSGGGDDDDDDEDDDPFGAGGGRDDDDGGDDFWGDDGGHDFEVDGTGVDEFDIDDAGGATQMDEAADDELNGEDKDDVFRTRGVSDFGLGGGDDFTAERDATEEEEGEEDIEASDAHADDDSRDVFGDGDDFADGDAETTPFGGGRDTPGDDGEAQPSDSVARPAKSGRQARSDSAAVLGVGSEDGLIMSGDMDGAAGGNVGFVIEEHSPFDASAGADDFDFDDDVADRKTDIESIGKPVIPGLEELDDKQPKGLGIGLAGLSRGKSKAKVRSGKSDEPVEYEDMGVKELRAELRRRKLGQLGGKKTLISRLEEDDRARGDGAGSSGQSPGSPLAAGVVGAPVFSFMKKSNRSRAEVEQEMKDVGAAMAAATANQQFERLASMATQMASLKKELEQLPADEPTADVGSGIDLSGFGAAAHGASDHRNIRLTATVDLTTALTDFMRKHDPAKAESAATLAAAIDGDDDAVRDLFLDLRKEYGVFPAWTGVKQLFGNGGSTSADGNNRLSVDGLKEAIIEFYARRAPEKVKNADAIVKIYGASREMLAKLYAQLRDIYDEVPNWHFPKLSESAGTDLFSEGPTASATPQSQAAEVDDLGFFGSMSDSAPAAHSGAGEGAGDLDLFDFGAGAAPVSEAVSKKKKEKKATVSLEDGYKAWGIKQLRLELRKRQLNQLGNKATLVQRLEESDAAEKTAGTATPSTADTTAVADHGAVSASDSAGFDFTGAVSPAGDASSQDDGFDFGSTEATAQASSDPFASMSMDLEAESTTDAFVEAAPESSVTRVDADPFAGLEKASENAELGTADAAGSVEADVVVQESMPSVDASSNTSAFASSSQDGEVAGVGDAVDAVDALGAGAATAAEGSALASSEGFAFGTDACDDAPGGAADARSSADGVEDEMPDLSGIGGGPPAASITSNDDVKSEQPLESSAFAGAAFENADFMPDLSGVGPSTVSMPTEGTAGSDLRSNVHESPSKPNADPDPASGGFDFGMGSDAAVASDPEAAGSGDAVGFDSPEQQQPVVADDEMPDLSGIGGGASSSAAAAASAENVVSAGAGFDFDAGDSTNDPDHGAQELGLYGKQGSAAEPLTEENPAAVGFDFATSDALADGSPGGGFSFLAAEETASAAAEAAEEAPVPTTAVEADPYDVSLKELRVLCRHRGLRQIGSRAALQARLRAADSGQGSQQASAGVTVNFGPRSSSGDAFAQPAAPQEHHAVVTPVNTGETRPTQLAPDDPLNDFMSPKASATREVPAFNAETSTPAPGFTFSDSEPAVPASSSQDAAAPSQQESAYAGLSLKDLRSQCRSRGLRQLGSKAELVQRLEAADNGGDATPVHGRNGGFSGLNVNFGPSQDTPDVVSLPTVTQQVATSAPALAPDDPLNDFMSPRASAQPTATISTPAGASSHSFEFDQPSAAAAEQVSAPPPAARVVADNSSSFSNWSLKDLRTECRRKGLRQIGSKADLIRRLESGGTGATPSLGSGGIVVNFGAPAAAAAAADSTSFDFSTASAPAPASGAADPFFGSNSTSAPAAHPSDASTTNAFFDSPGPAARTASGGNDLFAGESNATQQPQQPQQPQHIQREPAVKSVDQWSLRELRAEARRLGLSQIGTKAALIQSVKAAHGDSSGPGNEPGAPAAAPASPRSKDLFAVASPRTKTLFKPEAQSVASFVPIQLTQQVFMAQWGNAEGFPAAVERSFASAKVVRASQLYQLLGQLGVYPVSGIEQTGEVSGSARATNAAGPPVLIYCRVGHGAVVVQAKSANPAAATSMCDMLEAALSGS